MRTFKVAAAIPWKDGTETAIGVAVEVEFNKDNPRVANLVLADKTKKVIKVERLHHFLKGFAKPPGMRTLERYSMDSVCKSIYGKRVEPDGWDADGSPSWLLALGII